MTYFEWVNTLREIKSSPMDYDKLSELQDKVLSDGKYVQICFVSHIINTSVGRLYVAYDKLLKEIHSDMDLDNLSLEIIKYKKELKFIDKILDLPVIEKENKTAIKTNIDKIMSNIYEVLKKGIETIDTDGQYVSTFEKIMNSDMEG